MDKEYLLQELQKGLAEGVITPADLQLVSPKATPQSHHTGNRITETFLYIGAILIVIGIVTVVGSNWSSLNAFIHILITLGTGVATFISAVLLEKQQLSLKISNALHVIAAITLPLGLGVLCNEIGLDAMSFVIQMLIAVLLTIVYVPLLITRRGEVYLVMGTFWPLYLFGIIINHLNQLIAITRLMAATEIIIAGAAVTVLGSYYTSKHYNGWSRFGNILHVFGIIAFLGGLNSMVSDSTIMTLLFPLAAVGCMYVSVITIQEGSYVVSSVYLTAYLIWLTFRLFPNTTFALVFSGVIVMALGTISYGIQKKYLRKTYGIQPPPVSAS